MKHLHIVLLGLLAVLASSCSTTPKKDDSPAISKIFGEAFAPLYSISMIQSGAMDVLYCTASFRHKHDRWPKDYAELTAFVKRSDGYLILGEYERIDLRSLPDDGLEIGYIRPGRTNEMKLTLSSPVEKK